MPQPTHAVGDPVYVVSGSYGSHFYCPAIVTKVTPTGNVTVQFKRDSATETSTKRFTSYGREIGGDKWWADYLDDIPYEERTRLIAERKRCNAVHVVLTNIKELALVHNPSKHVLEVEVAQIEQLLAEAKTLIAAI